MLAILLKNLTVFAVLDPHTRQIPFCIFSHLNEFLVRCNIQTKLHNRLLKAHMPRLAILHPKKKLLD